MNTITELAPIFFEFLRKGNKLFNAALLADTEKDHVRAYYEFMQPESNSFIIDMGAGTGYCGELLQNIDPSLEVLNIVNDPTLIKLMKESGLNCLYESFENTSIEKDFADIVMFNESIGHGDLHRCMAEASRTLRHNGMLTIKDFTTTNQTQEVLSFESWGYNVYRQDIMIGVAYQHGFSLVEIKHPKMYTKHWFDIAKSNNVEYVVNYDAQNMPLCSVLYKFIKGNLNGRSQA